MFAIFGELLLYKLDKPVVVFNWSHYANVYLCNWVRMNELIFITLWMGQSDFYVKATMINHYVISPNLSQASWLMLS